MISDKRKKKKKNSRIIRKRTLWCLSVIRRCLERRKKRLSTSVFFSLAKLILCEQRVIFRACLWLQRQPPVIWLAAATACEGQNVFVSKSDDISRRLGQEKLLENILVSRKERERFKKRVVWNQPTRSWQPLSVCGVTVSPRVRRPQQARRYRPYHQAPTSRRA